MLEWSSSFVQPGETIVLDPSDGARVVEQSLTVIFLDYDFSLFIPIKTKA